MNSPKITLNMLGRWLAPSVFVVCYLVIFWQWTAGSGSALAQGWGPALIAIGSLLGLTGGYLALSQIMLQSRLPLIEGPFGRAGLVRVHRLNGYVVISALLIHATLVTVGYAINNNVNILSQYLTFDTSFPYVLWASLALLMLSSIGFISVTIVRRHLKYETWYLVHLLTYSAILLAIFHQLAVGEELIGQGWFRDFWLILYAVVFGSVLIFRVGRPMARALRYDFAVDRVVQEADNIISIYIRGKHLDQLNFVPGQFMIWRFLDGSRWWQAHPFTLSAAPNGQYLRLTPKGVGDFTRELPNLKPGTPVLVDGPYGKFTLAEETSSRLLFIAGGIGLTPLRAMMETLTNQEAVLIYAVRRVADIALRGELDELASKHNLRVEYVVSDEQIPGYNHGLLDAATIRRLAPDVAGRAVYLCGPPPMMSATTKALEALSVPPAAIHSERFAF